MAGGAHKSAFRIFSLCFLVLVALMSYGLDRTNFTHLLSGFAILFAIYFYLILRHSADDLSWRSGWLPLILAAHLVPLFALPNLSDDYFRFIWDARLFAMGINPFDFKPSEIVDQLSDPRMSILYEQLNSPDYYSVYPPWNQVVFQLAVTLFPKSIYGSVIVMKAILILAQLGSTYFLYLLAQDLQLPKNTALWYGLNPLVILELSGNLHFEGIMISMLLLCLLLLIRGHISMAAFAFSGAVLTKLHPLMLLPFILKALGWRKGFIFASAAAIFLFATTLPFILPFDQAMSRFQNINESLQLYYQTFEFNAGIYNIFRWIGYESYGYYNIQIVGKVMAVFTMLALAYNWLRMRSGIHGLIVSWYFAYLAYVLFGTTVHPWYILSLLPFALLLRQRMPIGWSLLVVLSYFAYGQADWHENFYLLTLEYTCIFVLLYLDLKIWRDQRAIHLL